MHPASRGPNGPHLRLTFGRDGRKIAIGRRATLATLLLVAAATVWSLVAGFYVCFHDSLLASLMSRQADMQYAYEDQIATLRTELDREASRDLIDRRTIETVLHDLTARTGRLEMRSTTIDRLLTEGTSARQGDRRPAAAFTATAPDTYRSSPAISVPPESGAASSNDAGLAPAKLRLSGAADGDHASLEPAALAAHLAAVEITQMNEVARLRDPLLRETRRLAAALADTGLRRRFLGDASRDVGGPFVPLEASGDNDRDFHVQVALVRDALDQRARLAAVVDHVPLQIPLDGPMEVSSTFGARVDPFLGRPALHTGIDLRETGSDAVHATAEGIVTAAGANGGYGNMVEIDHGAGIVTRYAHLSAFDVVVRQHVATGTVVGHVGSSGRATGPHLHYETRIDGEPVDPATFLIAGSRLAKD